MHVDACEATQLSILQSSGDILLQMLVVEAWCHAHVDVTECPNVNACEATQLGILQRQQQRVPDVGCYSRRRGGA
jgi:hypothetical protein